MDRREDAGEFYPDGKVISTRPVASGGDVKHSDFAGIEPLPERFTDEDVKTRLDQLIVAAKGGVAAVVALLLGAAAFGAGVTVQTAPKGTIYNDEQIVTNVVFDATGLAEVTNVYTKAETEAKIVELAPAETDPTVPAWAKAANKPTYTASEVGAIPTTGGVFNASLHLNQKLSVGTWTSSVKPYDISGGSGIAFVFGDNVQTKQSNTMTLGVGALNTNAWSFIWNGDADRMYIPGFPAMSNPYATRHNGGFHVNPSVRSGMVNPLQNFWIGDTNLNDWISALAPTPTWDTLSGKPTFATVATSGAYSDLSGKPTIPTTAADVGALSINGGTLNGGITVWGDSTFYGNVFSFSDTFKIKFMDAVMTPYFEIFGNDVYLPIGGGTLALTSDIPTTMAWSAITGKPTIPSTASDIGALPISGGTMTGNLVMGYNSLFQINGGGNAKFQFSWGSALDNLIISAYRETSGSYSIRFPTREGLLALTSDIPTSMAWDAITGKPTTISDYGITDALKSDFTSLTNNAAFTSAVAAVSPPTDLTHVEAEIETNRTAIATLSARAYIEVVSADEVYYVFTTNQE